MAADASLLDGVQFFQLLDAEERKTLADAVEVVRIAAGQTIFRVGEPGDSLYVVRSGEVEIFFRNDTGERIVLETCGAGGVFGEMSLLDGGARSASAEAKSEVEAVRVDRDDLHRLIRKHPEAALDLLAGMGRRLRETDELLRHTATRNVNEEMEDKRTLVQRVADSIAAFSGSIQFLAIHGAWFAVWIAINVGWVPSVPAFDPFPFGLLTMIVSLEAIFLSVFVLLSQNRQAEKDRIRSDIEYDVNLKAELEIAHLHEKLDELAVDTRARLAAIERSVRGGS